MATPTQSKGHETMGEDDQGQDTELGQEMAIPREQAIEQRPVPFLGDELAAAMTAGGSIYVALPGMCRALGLLTHGQLNRILRTSALAKGLRVIPLQTRGGMQPVNCLRVDRAALWLAGIEPSRVKPQFREKIEAYQEDLAPVAMQVFLRVAGIPTTALVPIGSAADPTVSALAEQIDTLTGVVNFLREHMDAVLASVATAGQVAGLAVRLDDAITLLESLAERQATTETQMAKIDERTQHLTPAHARTVQEMVDRMVQEMVDRMVRETRRFPTPLTYTIIYGRLKHRFRAGSYREVSDGQYENVMAYLREELRRATSSEAPEQGNLF